jgi:hypothetical protein
MASLCRAPFFPSGLCFKFLELHLFPDLYISVDMFPVQ